MKRISTPTRVIDKFGAGKDGFTNGDAVAGIPATDLEDTWFDHVQEEVAGVIEAMGIALDPSNRGQLQEALAGRLIGVQRFTASGTYTPTTGTRTVVVEVLGGGGGGGGCQTNSGTTTSGGQGGAGGAYGMGRYTSGFDGVAVTIGAGGTAGIGGVSPTQGGTGGTSSFGALLSAPGGAAGKGGSSATPPSLGQSTTAPGSGPTGANLVGMAGRPGTSALLLHTANDTGSMSGAGGDSPYGSGANGVSSQGPGVAGIGFGSGGSGGRAAGSGSGQNGGPGSTGLVIVWEYA